MAGAHSPKKTAKPVECPGVCFGGQFVKNVFDVDTTRNALRSFPHEDAQEPLTAFVDERDFIEVDDACSLLMPSVFLFPIGPQFADPRSSKPTMQNPSFFRRSISQVDL
jgi:hypothetical protein